MRKMSGKQLLVVKANCLRIIEANNGAVEDAKIQLAKVEKELARRNG